MSKKLLLPLIAGCAILTAGAQSTRISRVETYENDRTTPSRTYNFSYDASGRLIGSEWPGGSIKVTYNADQTIRIESSDTEPDLEWSVAFVENGRIARLDLQYTDESLTTSDLVYDSDGRLIKLSGNSYESTDAGFKWKDGNVISMTQSFESKTMTVNIVQSDHDTPASYPLYMPAIDGIDDFDLPSPAYYLPGYLGKMPRKLWAEVSGTIDGEQIFRASYSYKFDAYGNVSEIISDIREDAGWSYRQRIVCSYTTVTGAVEDVITDRAEGPEAVYDLYGRRMKETSRGLFIVKGADSTVRKVIEK